MKTGVIIGRFQVPKLTSGHWHLIKAVRGRVDRLVIVIGDAPLSLTNRNPLSYQQRWQMIKREAPVEAGDILVASDNPSDEVWSANLDKMLDNYPNPTLFGSRDCFIPYYKGKYPTINIPSIGHVSASRERELISQSRSANPDFLGGIIYAVENKFPIAYPTVDVAVLKWDGENTQILLGKKPGRAEYQLIGGFVDPADLSLEQAAARELKEETGNIQTHELKYIGSAKINDFRYKGTKDGIMTSLFMTYMMGGNPRPADDIEEIKWFDLADFDLKDQLVEHHHVLLKMLLSELGRKKFKVETFD